MKYLAWLTALLLVLSAILATKKYHEIKNDIDKKERQEQEEREQKLIESRWINRWIEQEKEWQEFIIKNYGFEYTQEFVEYKNNYSPWIVRKLEGFPYGTVILVAPKTKATDKSHQQMYSIPSHLIYEKKRG